MNTRSSLHFISGLPRSGSTLLAAILKQNPRFMAGMTSPVSGLFRAIEDATSVRQETSVFLSDDQRSDILKGLFNAYYKKVSAYTGVVFDTSRLWCARTSALNKLFPDAKMICCVRELGWIVDNFERLYRRNGQKPSAIYNFDTGGTVYSRSEGIASGGGVVGFAFNAFKEAYYSEFSKNLMIVDYENLCKSPDKVIAGVYDFIGEDKFSHDFNNVEYSAGEFDRLLGAEGLHDVKGKVEWRPRKSILPPDLFERYRNDNFWRLK